MSQSNGLQFMAVSHGGDYQVNLFPTLVLQADNWDDYTFKTSFDLYLYADAATKSVLWLGRIKVLKAGQETGWTELPAQFTHLDSQYCSVGQDITYYENLMSLTPEFRARVLSGLRDAASSSAIEAQFQVEQGWRTSLLRFGQAVNALAEGRKLLLGARSPEGQLSFNFNWRRGTSETDIGFSFDDSGNLPGRCHVLIGYNGVGKTTLLADLAMAASRGASRATTPDESAITGADTTFGAVIAVSYSAFDTFRTPGDLVEGTDAAPEKADDRADTSTTDDGRTAVFGYVYCGLRRLETKTAANAQATFGLKSIDEIEIEFVRALEDVGRGRSDARDHLVTALTALSNEPSFGRAGVDLSKLGSGLDSAGALYAFRHLSTGHKIVLNIVTQLAAHLRSRSLVLIDEPETHLHPPLMAALLRAVQSLLAGYDSFAIIATHSPVVVQEIQSQYVRVLERFETSVVVKPTEIETFGENIGAITRHVFSLDNSATDFQGTLADLASRYSADEIGAMFGPLGISAQARALIASYQANS